MYLLFEWLEYITKSIGELIYVLMIRVCARPGTDIVEPINILIREMQAEGKLEPDTIVIPAHEVYMRFIFKLVKNTFHQY